MARRFALTLALTGLLIAGSTASTFARPIPPGGENGSGSGLTPVETVVTAYFAAMNVGMQSGDFTAMVSLYDPRATVVWTSADGRTETLRGTAQITRYYKTAFAKPAGNGWMRDQLQRLSSVVILTREHLGGVRRAAQHSISVFVVRNGLIERLVWITYDGGRT